MLIERDRVARLLFDLHGDARHVVEAERIGRSLLIGRHRIRGDADLGQIGIEQGVEDFPVRNVNQRRGFQRRADPLRRPLDFQRAGHDAAWQAIMTHGGFGYAKEYHVERLFREVAITRLAPITEQLILSFIAEKVHDLPKSY